MGQKHRGHGLLLTGQQQPRQLVEQQMADVEAREHVVGKHQRLLQRGKGGIQKRLGTKEEAVHQGPTGIEHIKLRCSRAAQVVGEEAPPNAVQPQRGHRQGPGKALEDVVIGVFRLGQHRFRSRFQQGGVRQRFHRGEATGQARTASPPQQPIQLPGIKGLVGLNQRHQVAPLGMPVQARGIAEITGQGLREGLLLGVRHRQDAAASSGHLSVCSSSVA